MRIFMPFIIGAGPPAVDGFCAKKGCDGVQGVHSASAAVEAGRTRLLSRMGIEATSQDVLLQWARQAAEHHADGVRLVAEFWPVQGARPDHTDEPRVEKGPQ